MPSDFSVLQQAPRIRTQNIQTALSPRTAVLSSGSGGFDCVQRSERTWVGSGLALLSRPGTHPKPSCSDKNKRLRVLGHCSPVDICSRAAAPLRRASPCQRRFTNTNWVASWRLSVQKGASASRGSLQWRARCPSLGPHLYSSPISVAYSSSGPGQLLWAVFALCQTYPKLNSLSVLSFLISNGFVG